MVNKRGQKTCGECGTINGVRAFECKDCDAEFKMKKARKRPHYVPVEDFRTLEHGDEVKVIGGSGPYYENKETGDRTYLTDRGTYRVIKTDKTGIQVYGGTGHGYLYMGKTCRSDIVASITKTACKIKKRNIPNYMGRTE